MKKIEWLDNFAESYSNKMNKTASKKLQSIIVDRAIIKNASIGDIISYNGKQYKVADANFVDDKGEGAVLDEVGYGEGIPENDPMSIAMGAPVINFTEGMKPQEYSRTNPGDIYDTSVEENFEQTAVETANQIANENAVDRTIVENHYTDIRTKVPVEKTLVTTDTEVETTEDETPVEDIIDSEDEVETQETESKEEVNEISKDDELEKTESLNDNCVEAEDTDNLENDDENDTSVTATRYNRILRRIMGSK